MFVSKSYSVFKDNLTFPGFNQILADHRKILQMRFFILKIRLFALKSEAKKRFIMSKRIVQTILKQIIFIISIYFFLGYSLDSNNTVGEWDMENHRGSLKNTKSISTDAKEFCQFNYIDLV